MLFCIRRVITLLISRVIKRILPGVVIFEFRLSKPMTKVTIRNFMGRVIDIVISRVTLVLSLGVFELLRYSKLKFSNSLPEQMRIGIIMEDSLENKKSK